MKDIFQFHHDVIDRYKEFSEGFAKIASQDIREYADQIFREENKYTPPPLIQLNMNYSPGMTIEQMSLTVVCTLFVKTSSASRATQSSACTCTSSRPSRLPPSDRTT